MKFLYQVSDLTKKPVEIQYHLEDSDAIVARDALLKSLSGQPSSNKEQVSLALVAYDALSTEEQLSARASIAEIFSKESATKLAAFRSDARNLGAYQEMVGHNLSPDSPHVLKVITQRFEKWFEAELGKTRMLTRDEVRTAAADDAATWQAVSAASLATERLRTYAAKLNLTPEKLSKLLDGLRAPNSERGKAAIAAETYCAKVGLNIMKLCAAFELNYRSVQKDLMVEQRLSRVASSWPPSWKKDARDLNIQIARIQDDSERRAFLKAHHSDAQPSAKVLSVWITDAVSAKAISRPRRGARPAVIQRCQAYLQAALDKVMEKEGSPTDMARLIGALAALSEESIMPTTTEKAEGRS